MIPRPWEEAIQTGVLVIRDERVLFVCCIHEEKQYQTGEFLLVPRDSISSHSLLFHVQFIHAAHEKSLTQADRDYLTHDINFQEAPYSIGPL